jgi:hypothetical protein
LAVQRVLSLAVLALRRSGSKEIEILVLRHELEFLRRNQPRPHLEHGDRAWLAALSWLHYGDHRPHRALALRPPHPLTAEVPSTPAMLTNIRQNEILGGLIDEYHVAA